MVSVRTLLVLGAIAGAAGLLLLSSTSGCAEDATKPKPGVNPDMHQLSTGRPLTIPAEISEDARPAVASLVKSGSGPQAIMLEVQCGLVTSPNAPVIRVFVGKPDASVDTSTKDPHFLDTFTIFPAPSPPDISPESLRFSFDATKVLSHLAASGKLTNAEAVDVTFVALPDRKSSQSAAVPFRHVRLKAGKEKRR